MGKPRKKLQPVFVGASGGFTIIEVVAVMVILGVATAMALPSLLEHIRTIGHRQAARDIASTLRQARSMAIAENWEHRVEFDVDGRKYRMTRGNRANNSSSWPTVVRDWMDVPAGVDLTRNADCNSGTDTTIHFNPNGTSDSQYVCVADSSGVARFRVGVSSSVTGRVKVDDPN